MRLVTPAGPREALDLVPADPVIFPQPSPLRPGLRLVRRLLLAFAALQVLDLASTLVLLRLGGTEANPLSAWLLGYGVPAFVAAKLGLAALLAGCVPLLRRFHTRQEVGTAKWACVSLDAVYAFTVLSNVLQCLVFA